MTTNDYIFEKHADDQELQRMKMIEAALDERTITHIQSTGIGDGWRCLELGAGAGSIMQWMAEIVGERGNVVAVDRKTAYIESRTNVQILEGDFLDLPIEGSVDLAHCRYVLIHNRNDSEVLSKVCGLLKPSGFLVVEEPDFTSARLLGVSHDPAQKRVNNAICRLFESMQLDPAYGLSLPEKIASEGLKILSVDSQIHLANGGSPVARMMEVSTRALAEKYIDTGEADQEDIDQYALNASNEQLWSIYYTTVSVIAMKC